MYDIEKKDILPDFIGKIVYLNFLNYKGKDFVSFILEQTDLQQRTTTKFEVFDTALVQQFADKKFKLYDYIGVCFTESIATNSKTNEQFTKRRVTETFAVHKNLNLSKYAWQKYSQTNKSVKVR